MLDLATLAQPDSRNQYLVAPPEFGSARPHRTAPQFPGTAADLAERFLAIALAEPRVTLRRRRDDGLALELVQRSALLRFPDIITAEFISAGDARATLAIHSRSVYGRRDFGVNRKRVDDWLAKLARQ